MIRALLAVLICVGLASCVQFGYRRQIIERKPDAELLEQFVAGQARLGDVLEVLGAPLEVFEGASGAPVITYGGLRSAGWDLSVSAPVSDYASASVTYAENAARTEGYVLIFDVDERLTIVHAGNLGDLREAYVRRRPASVDEEDADDGERAKDLGDRSGADAP